MDLKLLGNYTESFGTRFKVFVKIRYRIFSNGDRGPEQMNVLFSGRFLIFLFFVNSQFKNRCLKTRVLQLV